MELERLYANTPVGTFPNHKFVEHSAQGEEFESLPKTGGGNFHHVIEWFVDDYISLAISTSQEQLRHVTNKVMKGINDVFQADTYDKEYSILLKKLKTQEAQWNLEKEVLGFHFDGIKKTI